MSKNGAPNKWQLFWRIQNECWRRSVTPYVMYLIMSLIMLASQSIGEPVLAKILGVLCILGGFAYNAHLTYGYGKYHYDNFLTGNIYRKNEEEGLFSNVDHKEQLEYRPYKGFLIGFYVSIPVIFFAVLAGCLEFASVEFSSLVQVIFIMFAGWAIVPIRWISTSISTFYALIMIVFPVLISGVFYIVGAYKEAKVKYEERSRMENVEAKGKKGKK